MLQLLERKPERKHDVGDNPLKGKLVLIPPMAHGSARLFAAGFRALGVDAHITPPSDHVTRELGAHYTSGDECYPAKVTVGDFMKALTKPGAEPERTSLFMPTADGPCRFGQYAPYLRAILDSNGFGSTSILSPTSKNGYSGLGHLARPFLRTGWRMLVAGDILQKMLLVYRPHEEEEGAADNAYEMALEDVATTVEQASIEPRPQLHALRQAMIRSRDRFHSVHCRRDRSRPLIGVVGEIFCRLNTFSNDDLVRRVEEYGGDAWISDITEWIWYTNAEQFRKLKLRGRLYSTEAFGAWLRNRVQYRDEHALLEPFKQDFIGYEEPPVHEILAYAEPYLPSHGALGEMVLNVGKAVYLAKKGVDGIIDISPFTCMNGIVSEAIYPRLSRDLGGLPIRSFYFDGTQSDLDRDLGVYIELAKAYQKRKTHSRTFPA
jgi:predicted nucleotide-binding protein (sugar kinase/HSP70/actin superfamily)